MKSGLLLLGILLILCSCEQEGSSNQSLIPKGSYPDQESWDATVIISDEGRTVGEITAGHVEKYSSRQLLNLSDSIIVHFYNRSGVHTSVLYAEGGIVYEKKQDMMAFGNVVVISDSGVTLFTDTLNWNNEDQKVYSKTPVKVITDKSDTLYGESFISDPDLINYEIIKPRGKSSKRITIQDEQ